MGRGDETSSDLSGTAWCDPPRLPRHLRIDRRPRRVHESRGHVTLMKREYGIQRLRRLSHRGPGITLPSDPLRHAGDCQRIGMDHIELIPGERCRHLGTGPGAHRPCAEDRLVRSVLVEVYGHSTTAFLLSPSGGDELGMASLELACDGKRGCANFIGGPPRL